MVTIEAVFTKPFDYVLLTLEDGTEYKVVDARTWALQEKNRLPAATLSSIMANILRKGSVEFIEVTNGRSYSYTPPSRFETVTFHEGEFSTTGIVDMDYENYSINLVVLP